MQPLPRPCREVRTACAPRSADSALSSFSGISSHISDDGCRFPALIGREELTSSCPQLSAVKSSLFQCAAGDDTECSSWAAHAPGFDFLSEQIGATAGLELRIYVENIVVVGDWREDDWRTSIYGLVTSCVYVHAALSSSFCPWVWLWIKVVSGAVRDSRSQPNLPDFSLSHIFFSLLFIPSFYLFVAGAQGHIFPSLKLGLFLSLPLTLWVTAIGKRSRIRSCFHLQVEMNGGLSAAHMWLFPRKKKLLWLQTGSSTPIFLPRMWTPAHGFGQIIYRPLYQKQWKASFQQPWSEVSQHVCHDNGNLVFCLERQQILMRIHIKWNHIRHTNIGLCRHTHTGISLLQCVIWI